MYQIKQTDNSDNSKLIFRKDRVLVTENRPSQFEILYNLLVHNFVNFNLHGFQSITKNTEICSTTYLYHCISIGLSFSGISRKIFKFNDV